MIASRTVNRITSVFERVPDGPRFRPFLELLLPLLGLGLATWLIRITDFDMDAARWLQKVGGGDWKGGDHPFWRGLYQWGPYPATLTMILSLIGVVLGWRFGGLRRWRKVLLFLILCEFIGPLFIVNLVLKDHWGRPRPREVAELGGWTEFEPVLHYKAGNDGKSFPSGHATAGFYFLAGYFLFRRQSKEVAASMIFGALCFGGLLGIARMVQGGHFLSDILWSAAICWFVPMILYYSMGMDRAPLIDRESITKHIPLWRKIAFGVGLPILIVPALYFVPYKEERSYKFDRINKGTENLRIHLALAAGRAEIVPGEKLSITGNAFGHGFPTAHLGKTIEAREDKNGIYFIYGEHVSKSFHELDTRVRIEIPWSRVRSLTLRTGKADVTLRLDPSEQKTLLRIQKGEGTLTIDAQGQGIEDISKKPDLSKNANSQSADAAVTAVYRLKVEPEFQGVLKVIP